MLEFAERLTRAPWDMDQADVDELRQHGFDDRDVHDITQVAAYFNYINRVADGLGVRAGAVYAAVGTHRAENQRSRIRG